MNPKNLRSVCLLLTALAASAAFGQDKIEKVVVRNRLYETGGKVEVGADVGVSVLSRLTDQTNLTAHLGYNLSNSWAVELRAGYGLSRHTGLANKIAEDFTSNTSILTADDLADLWEMNANGMVGLRWAPIYGKISLMAELPVHFQAYLWLGGGAAQFKRESIVYCTQGSAGSCDAYLTESKVGPVASLALGMRFFATPNHSIKVEVRDYSFPDSYRVDINRAAARSSSDTGTPMTSPGITNLAQIDLGYSYTF